MTLKPCPDCPKSRGYFLTLDKQKSNCYTCKGEGEVSEVVYEERMNIRFPKRKAKQEEAE